MSSSQANRNPNPPRFWRRFFYSLFPPTPPPSTGTPFHEANSSLKATVYNPFGTTDYRTSIIPLPASVRPNIVVSPPGRNTSTVSSTRETPTPSLHDSPGIMPSASNTSTMTPSSPLTVVITSPSTTSLSNPITNVSPSPNTSAFNSSPPNASTAYTSSNPLPTASILNPPTSSTLTSFVAWESEDKGKFVTPIDHQKENNVSKGRTTDDHLMMLVQLDGGGVEEDVTNKKLTKSKSRRSVDPMMIREEIKNQVVPAIEKIVQAAVAKEVSIALEKTLPSELEKHFVQISSTFESSLTSLIRSTVLPSIHQSVNSLTTNVLEEIKESRQEQSDARGSTEHKLYTLRADVTGLKAALERMENIVISIQGSLSAPPPPSQTQAIAEQLPQVQQTRDSTQQRLSTSQRQETTETQYTLPPIPRSKTPLDRYEDLFTNALQPENAPEFPALLHLINSSPTHRLSTIFPPPPIEPLLSSPVIHSLAIRLGQILESQEGSLDEASKIQLMWLSQSLTALVEGGKKDAKTAPFTPRIIENVIASLIKRGNELNALKDRKGEETVRKVEEFARGCYVSSTSGVGVLDLNGI